MKNLYFRILIIAVLSLNPIYNFAQVSTDSLILYLPFNGDVLDYSGNNNNGIAHDIEPDTNRFGDLNSSYRFNGSSSYVEIPASPSMNSIQTVDEVTITAWININQWHASGNVFSIFERYNPTNDSGWLLEANWVGGGILFLADESNMNNWIGCDFTMNFDQWYHLGFTYSQAQQMAHFYIDGVNVCSSSYSPPINVADTTTSFIIGRSLAGPDEYSDGQIDEYKIYSRILTSDEIEETFETEKKEIELQHSVDVFPNPANDILMIKTSGAFQSSQYSIVDVSGKVIISGNVRTDITRVDMSSIAPGLYFLIVNGEHPFTTRVIKK